MRLAQVPVTVLHHLNVFFVDADAGDGQVNAALVVSGNTV